ncbi:unnamed protein product, partial [Parnassius apollo]
MFNAIGGAFRSIGEKTASLFERKKKDVEQIAAEKAEEAAHVVEEHVKKAGELVDGVHQTADQAANSAATA